MVLVLTSAAQAQEALRAAIERHQKGELPQARALYEAVLAFQPKNPDVLHLLGLIAGETGDHKRAADLIGRALTLNPNNPGYHYNRGLAQQQINNPGDALVSYDAAIALNPDYAEAHNNRGAALQKLGRVEEAVAAYERALALKPALDFAQYLHAKMLLCDWRGLQQNLKELAARIGGRAGLVAPFAVLGLIDDPALQQKAAQTWMRVHHPDRGERRRFPKRSERRKIRLGYYSADFHEHATSYLIAELLEVHDRERFEIYGFSYGPKTGDVMQTRIAAAFSKFIDIDGVSDGDVAQLSAKHGIDIAIDLKGLTADSRPGLFAERCAPIQVNFLGYPGTMGASFFEYIIADKVVIPLEEQSHFAEKVAYLPHCYQPNDSKRKISDREFTRSELGLPESGFVFCCFNNPYKILPETFDSWMRILAAVDGSVLWLLAGSGAAAANLRREAQARDVDGPRLVFADRMALDEHLARHRLADLFLDTLPYNAHTTASDALWAGLPVLTQTGRSFASRVGASLLGALGLDELITTTQTEYETRAIELAKKVGVLAAVRDKLAEKRSITPLFDGAPYARHIEAAYETMHAKRGAGLAPDVISIKPQG